ncbi:MAG: S8 family serine peptidase [Pseudomonadota bacterium]
MSRNPVLAAVVHDARRHSPIASRTRAPGVHRHLSRFAAVVLLGLAALPATVTSAGDSERTITVAIVDDGIDFKIPSLHPFAWQNGEELSGNRVDDDQNGLIDDRSGWDFADGDADPAPPSNRLDRDHGTYLALLVVGAAKAVLAPEELASIRIMPVKVMSDAPGELRLRKAYAGVAYAAQQGADVILMAWNDPVISAEEEAVLRRARARGALLIGSAGNLGVEKPMYPAAHEAVLAVAALKAERRLRSSNYGGYIDMAAPGFQVGEGSPSQFGLRPRDGTSPAAAAVAAAAVALFARRPDAHPLEIRACLLATASPVTGLIDVELGRVGAGRLDTTAALSCIEEGARSDDRLDAPKSVLFAGISEGETRTHFIAPNGVFDSIDLSPLSIPGLATRDMQLRIVDAQRGRVLFSDTLNAMKPISTPATELEISLIPGASAMATLPVLAYAAKPRPLQNRFCREPTELLAPTVIEDGSAAQDYAPGSDCHWLVTAPPGYGLNFTFLELDTEPRRDLVYLFAGPRTNAEIAAVVSGNELPGTIRVPRSQSLVWFVTDLANQSAGFRLRVDLEPAEQKPEH